jgi:hypothetical protein
VLEPKLIYRHDVDLFGLAKLQHTFEKAPKGWVVLGVTVRNDELRLEVRSRSLGLPGGRLCLWVEEVTARIGDPELDVYVAANYPVGTCEYSVVLEHENQHVAINRSVVHAWGPRIGAQLRDVVYRSFPLIVDSAEPAKQAITFLAASVKPLVDAMIEELRQRNGAIDTPENYRRTGERCKNWLPPGTRLPDSR